MLNNAVATNCVSYLSLNEIKNELLRKLTAITRQPVIAQYYSVHFVFTEGTGDLVKLHECLQRPWLP
jgi:hypothetical protein